MDVGPAAKNKRDNLSNLYFYLQLSDTETKKKREQGNKIKAIPRNWWAPCSLFEDSPGRTESRGSYFIPRVRKKKENLTNLALFWLSVYFFWGLRRTRERNKKRHFMIIKSELNNLLLARRRQTVVVLELLLF